MKNLIYYLIFLLPIVSCGEREWVFEEVTSYPNGQFQTIKAYPLGKKDYYVEYQNFESGKLKSITEYTSGNLDGLLAEYYENGQLKKLMAYKAGKAHGEAKGWYEDGVLLFIEENEQGQKVYFKRYYPSAILGSSINYVNGRKTHGKFYHKNGELRMEGDYRYDNRINNWNYYDTLGALIQTINHGDPVGDRVKKAQSEQK